MLFELTTVNKVDKNFANIFNEIKGYSKIYFVHNSIFGYIQDKDFSKVKKSVEKNLESGSYILIKIDKERANHYSGEIKDWITSCFIKDEMKRFEQENQNKLKDINEYIDFVSEQLDKLEKSNKGDGDVDG